MRRRIGGSNPPPRQSNLNFTSSPARIPRATVDGKQHVAVKPYNGRSYCNHRPLMHSHHIHLPTEIIVLTVSFAASDEDDARRQRSMYACCLLSRQWYSAAIEFLYERPRLDRGLSFKKFTDTVCPPIAARKSKLNLGSLVRRLDLSGLVHHSSNSLTARLLGRIRANLEVFIAPSVSFAWVFKATEVERGKGRRNLY